MATSADIGYGTTFSWNAQLIGEVTSISGVNITVSKQDATLINATDATKEIKPGLIDPGDVTITGWCDPDDTGQALMWTDLKARTKKAWLITFPASISSAVWGGNGYLLGFSTDEVTPEGLVPFTAVIGITELPTWTP